MSSERSRASTAWTPGEAWLLDHFDPKRQGQTLGDLIVRASRLPGGVHQDQFLRTIRRFLGSGLLEEREGRFLPTEMLASLRSSIDDEIDSWCANEGDESHDRHCDEAPDFGDLMLKRLRNVPVQEADWNVSDRAYRSARLRAWWSSFWVIAFVRIPLGVLAAAILILGTSFSLLWWLLKRLGTVARRPFGHASP
ncbi:MAG: hypothetical protein JW722_03790 [Demequinaceae bacterium]|nr:hypothetical protein [Demequinaceae bacterium]